MPDIQPREPALPQPPPFEFNAGTFETPDPQKDIAHDPEDLTGARLTGELPVSITHQPTEEETSVPLNILQPLPIEGKSAAYIEARERYINQAAEHAYLYHKRMLPISAAERERFEELQAALARTPGDSRPTFWDTFANEITDAERDAIGRAVAARAEVLRTESLETKKSPIPLARKKDQAERRAYEAARASYIEDAAQVTVLHEEELLKHRLTAAELKTFAELKEKTMSFWNQWIHFLPLEERQALVTAVEMRARLLRQQAIAAMLAEQQIESDKAAE